MAEQDPPTSMQSSMREALRLVGVGRLMDATIALQQGLGVPRAATATEASVIDIVAESIPQNQQSAPESPIPQEEPGQQEGPPADPPGTLVSHRLRHAGRVLGYRLYTPASAKAGSPLVVMLHGCTQTPEDFALGTGMNALADAFGVFVAWPAQPRSANPSRCWNWFDPENQARNKGEPDLFAAMVRRTLADTGADPARVFAAGLSAGGAAAAILASTYPDLFAAVGIHSGLACGAAADVRSALDAMRQGGEGRPNAVFVPTISFHGDADQTVARANADAITRAALANAGGLVLADEHGKSQGRSWSRTVGRDASGVPRLEQWTIHGAGHGWSGGNEKGSHTDASGPCASREMLRFFLAQKA